MITLGRIFHGSIHSDVIDDVKWKPRHASWRLPYFDARANPQGGLAIGYREHPVSYNYFVSEKALLIKNLPEDSYEKPIHEPTKNDL